MKYESIGQLLLPRGKDYKERKAWSMDTPDILTRSRLFAGMGPEEQDSVLSAGHRREYSPGTVVFREGDPAGACYLVLEGRLKLVKLHEEGKQVVIRYINPGEVTAAIAISGSREYPVTAYAEEKAVLIGWERKAMFRLMMDLPRLAINIMDAAVLRLEDIQQRYLELCAEKVEQRIARALLRIVNRPGTGTDGLPAEEVRLNRQDLADYAGTTIYTVSRTLGTWEKKGWVSPGRERILITDPTSLEAFSEAGPDSRAGSGSRG